MIDNYGDILKSKNTFFALGVVGITITVLLNLFLATVLNLDVSNWWVYYIVWIVFLTIGLARKAEENKNQQKKKE